MLCWAPVLTTLFAQAAHAQSFIAIQKVSPVVRKHFTAVPPPTATGDRWGMDDGHTTFWSYTVKPVLGADVLSLEPVGSVWNACIQVKRATVRVGLVMDIYLGEHPTPGDIERHEGYALICQRLYKDSEAATQTAANQLFAQKISARGPTAEGAVQNALTKAVLGFESSYFMNSGNKAQRLSRAYDLVCAQATVTELTAAVNESFRIIELNPGIFNKPRSAQRPPRPFSREYPPR